jgi:O-methyltransferase
MIPFENFAANLELCEKFKDTKGCVVECGVWRGGMSAAMTEVLGNKRTYYLFDSFEGLPDAKEIDGKAALKWQKDKTAPNYFNNCAAEIEYAQKAMSLSKAGRVEIVKGWFNETLAVAVIDEPIAVLRLDGDWYDSTMDCMENLYPKVVEGGLVLMDDYYFWDGFSKAIHDYLSKNKLPVRINQWSNSNLYYVVKKSEA